MTSPVRAFHNEETDERFYTAVNPLAQEPRVSVTSVLHTALPKQKYLMPWAALVVAETAVEFMQDVLEHRYDIELDEDELDWDAIAADLKNAWKWERDEAGDIGDQVHDACESIMRSSKGNPDIAQAIIEGGVYDDAVVHRLEHLLTWLRADKVRTVATEFTIYNDTFEYAGSCDLAAYVNSQPYYLDFKSGRVNPDAALQLVAYKNGEYIVDAQGEVHPMPFAVGAKTGVVTLKPGHCALIETEGGAHMFGTFIKLLELRKDWFGSIEKEALGNVMFDSRKVNSDDVRS